jgi:hypothetical protein
VLITFLQENLDVFAWQISDMSGIPKEVIEHRFGIDPTFKPIKQKERRYTPERHETIGQPRCRSPGLDCFLQDTNPTRYHC